MKLKKHFYTAIIPILLLTGIGTHIIAMILYAIAHEKELRKLTLGVLFNKKVYIYLFADPNGKTILIGAMILFFVLSLYLVRQSIFQKTYYDDSDFGVHGSARFEDPERLMNGKMLSKDSFYSKSPKKALEMEEGILLGKIGRKLLVIHDKSQIDNRNVLVLGSSGSGKGQSHVLNNIINKRTQSVINIDVKGENWALTHQIKVDQGYKVGRLDFVDFKGWGFNPMAFVQNDEDAEKLANITAKNALADGKEDFFQERARTLLKNLIVYTKTNFSQENANFDSLLRVFDDFIANEKVFKEWIEEQDQSDVGVQGLKSFFASLTGKTRSSVTSSFDSIVSVYRLEKVRQMTKKSDFDFEDFVKDKYALYIKIGIPTNPYTSLTSAFFTQMIDAFYSIARKSPISELPTPVNLILDEFANIGTISGYATTLATCRSYLIYITTIIQDLSQLEKNYGKDDFRNILANHDTKLILRISEKETARYFSDYFGETTVRYNEVTGTGRNTESRATVIKKPLLTSNDLTTMPKDVAYVQFTGFNVCKIEKAWQYEIYKNMVTNSERDYVYPEFRKQLLNVEEHPLYKEEVIENKVITFTDMFNKKKEYIEAHQQEHEMNKQAEQYQEEIRQPLSFNSDSEESGNAQLVKEKIENRLEIMKSIETLILNSDDINDKSIHLNQIRTTRESLVNGESESIKKLVGIKDRNLKAIKRLEARRIESSNDAEHDENDNLTLTLTEQIQEELKTQEMMIKIIDTNPNIVSEAIKSLNLEINRNESVRKPTLNESPEITILDVAESHFSETDHELGSDSYKQSNEPLVAVGTDVNDDTADPFKNFNF